MEEKTTFLPLQKKPIIQKLISTSSKELFEKGESDPEFLLNMMRLYSDSDYELAKKVSERYFKVKKDALTRDEVGLLLFFLKSPNDPNYKIFTDRKQEIIGIMSEDVYKQFDVNIKLSTIIEKSLDIKAGTINDDYFYKNAIPLVGKTDAETALNRMKVIFFQAQETTQDTKKSGFRILQKRRKFRSRRTPESRNGFLVSILPQSLL